MSKIVLTMNSDYMEDRFRREVAEPVEAKFPNEKIQHVREDPLMGDNMNNWRDSGKFPDLHLLNGQSTHDLIVNGLSYDMRELNRKINLNDFEYGLLQYGIGANEEVFALPYTNGLEYPLFYNKDIFDQFGVPYPTDGMTWDEVIELAKKVTGEINGISYMGLDVADLFIMQVQVRATPIDPKTGRATIYNEKWRKIAQTIKAIYGIKGNILPNPRGLLGINRFFVRDKNVAMGVVCTSCFKPEDLDFNWDIVSYPVYEERVGPNLYTSLMLSISPTCPEKELAFEIISYLVSDEFQKENARNGILTSLTKKEVQTHFGENVPFYQNKNTQALFYNHPTAPTPFIPKEKRELMYNVFGNPELRHARPRWKFVDMILEDKSVDETLQELESDLNKAMEEMMSSQV